MAMANPTMALDAVPATSSELFNPAPYGRSCEACARAKCKCFYRALLGTGCERCHRRGIACRQSVRTRRKHKAWASPSSAPASAPAEMLSSTRLEAKLDDLVSLLLSQAAEKPTFSQAQTLQPTPHSTPTDNSTPSATGATIFHDESVYSTPTRDPDVLVDMTVTAVRLVRPNSPPPISSSIFDDVLAYKIPERLAEEQLCTFRSVFLPMFPFQFVMEKMIWDIISRRIVLEHLADLDLLLGVVCFASWSHYFKQDKPFMNMLAQLAMSLAAELGLHEDISTNRLGRNNSYQASGQRGSLQPIRTLEEHRTMLAVYHLISSRWTAYRKREPLRWTIKCQLIVNQLTCSPTDDSWECGVGSPSVIMAAALLRQVEDLRRSLPTLVRSERSTQLYLNSAKLAIQAQLLSRPVTQDHTYLARLQRLQDLDSTLSTIESWLAVFFEVPLFFWIGISVDVFAQFTHRLVVLFKLTTLEEPSWDLEEVRRRAGVFEVLDRAAEAVDRVPVTLGIVDAEGPRRGLLFKTSYLFRAIKALFLANMTPQQQRKQHQSLPVAHDSVVELGGDGSLWDELMESLWDEPWFSDIMGTL
ncbi:hypothetical protein F5Y19DRAFT_484081 [Xylariaceae sp. FL1651]|nr:hypothetical protein F5Y19DRAFT_484081 [Xylariaceae sp. FL1651]